MPRTLKLYQFRELDAAAQARAIEDGRDGCVDSEWYDVEMGQQKERLEELGFSDPDISFSGFWCQGDGASFTASSLDLDKFLSMEGRWRPEFRLLEVAGELGYAVWAKVGRPGTRYVHEHSTTVELDSDIRCDGMLGKRIDALVDSIRDMLQEYVVTLNKEIYEGLEKEYEYMRSDEVIAEQLEQREYWYTAKGVRVEAAE